MMNWFIAAGGFLLTCLGVWETFMAVLHPRATVGPITKVINFGFHFLVRTQTFAHPRVLVHCGPALIVTQVLCWATLLLFGISMIVWSQLGSGITATGSTPTDTDFATAVYYSGFTITTLGVGDLVPRTPAIQFLTITAAGLGFSFFTLVLAYVISVYSTLARRNQFANEIEYRTGRTGDSLGYLRAYLAESDPSLVNQDLYTLSSNMAELLESHHFYPVLHYFRFSESRYAMSRMLRFCLEVSSIMRAARQVDGYKPAASVEAVDRLWHASMQMLEETKRHFVVCHSARDDPDPRLAVEVARSIGDSDDLASQLQAAFVDQQSVWLQDLNALAVCTRSESGKES
ncbi:potassium channel family protein [Roseiconus lacunae]|uniref:Potassium channel family protein n=1 Tax=Roseiconus lacunae TaxID=2605694 RepID=A0ABT7PEZ8_9BACT|nr:potassium channel family protein [Roseiconus lacunae]MDM4015070.1 potassium channel family protein [Roseiconus lacunae]